MYDDGKKNAKNGKGDEDVVLPNRDNKQMSNSQRKVLIKKASKAVNKQYSEAFKMISKN